MTQIYDDPEFFADYAQMPRSRGGLEAAGEWPDFKQLLPALDGLSVLDLGCGYGWHCRYFVAYGAASAIGVDVSVKMLEEAKRRTDSAHITYQQGDLATFTAPAASFDLVLSSLALHYVADFDAVVQNVARMLKPGGQFLFTIEHPIFTAEGSEQWQTDEAGNPTFWPVDRYFDESARQTQFLGQTVEKQHHTLQTLVSALLTNGLTLTALVEPQGQPVTEGPRPLWQRAPMMLIMRAQKA